MYLKPALDIQIRDSIFDPSGVASDAVNRIARTLKSGGKTHYKVWIYASGNDLPYVDYIEYTLHPTFRQPIHKVQRSPSNPDCRLVIWTWGLFDVKAKIVDKQGRQYEMIHSLKYDRQFDSAKRFEGEPGRAQ